MTSEQYERWKDFSLRMAEHAFPQFRETNREKLKKHVRHFFWVKLDGDQEEIESIEDWDSGSSMLVCDSMTLFITDCLGFPVRQIGERSWSFVSTASRDAFRRAYSGWQGEEREDFYGFRRHEIWGSLIHCCVRAGLDVAVSPSAGVVGFDLGDLRRMYPEGLPEWVTAFFREPIDELADTTPVWL